MDLALLAGVACVLVAALAAVAARRLLLPAVDSDFDLGRLGAFSPEFYRPMGRLLDGWEDMDFLRGQDGFQPEMATQFRRNRRMVLRQYLRHLRTDWMYLNRAARFVLAHCEEDRSDLAVALLRQGVRFWLLLAWTHVSVEASYYRIALPTVDVRRLVGLPEWLGLETNRVIASAVS